MSCPILFLQYLPLRLTCRLELHKSSHWKRELRRCMHYGALGSREFRLLRGRQEQNGTLYGELRTFPIESMDTPSFNAVSYSWGPPAFSKSIRVEGFQVPIPDSLFAFLQKALNKNPETWWWADSICINQLDDTEKSLQVPLMKDIFETASITYVWLGEKSEDSDTAMVFLQYLGEGFWHEYKNCSSVQHSSWIETLSSRSGEHRAEWDALERLFQRSWWRRVWTVQEYIVSSSITLQCGDVKIDGQIFNKALSAIWACHRATGSFRYDAQWNRNRILENHNLYYPSASVTALLAYLGDHFSTDPRDRLYSLSGLAHDADILDRPNYDTSVTSLYTNLVKSFVRKYKSLDIICFATAFTEPERNSAADQVPTWVPDWIVPVTPLVVPLMVSQGAGQHIGSLRPNWAFKHSASYTASLGRHPEVSLSADNRSITCKGLVLDIIDGLSQVSNWMSPRTDRQRQEDALEQSTFFQDTFDGRFMPHQASNGVDIVSSIMRCLVLDRKDHYLSYTAPKARFLNELRALIDAATVHNGAGKYPHFTAWFHANRSFRVQGIGLAKLFEDAFSTRIPSAHELPEPYGHSGDSERQTFASRFHDTTAKMARRLIVTHQGLLAMAPRRSRKGDVICILYGCSVPVVLRKSTEADCYYFIGECYADGYMNGEALSHTENLEEKDFCLV